MEKSTDYSFKEVMTRFWPYYRKYWKTEILDLFCAALTTLCELVLPMILKYITNTAISETASLTMAVIGKLGLLYLALCLIDLLASFFMIYNGHIMGIHMETDMRTDAYEHLQKLSCNYFNNTKIGQIMGRITNDLFDVTEFAHHCPEEFLIAGLKGIVSFVILLKVNVPLTLALFALIPITMTASIKINHGFRGAQRKQRVQIGELNARIEDSLLGQKVVKAFANEDLECEKFAEGNVRFFHIKKEMYRYMSFFMTTTRITGGAMYLVVILLGGYMLLNGHLTAGDLVAYVMYVATLVNAVRRIVDYAEQFTRGITGIERFLEIMDSDIEIFDAPDAAELKDVQGNIRFDDVSFVYEGTDKYILKNVDLSVSPGERLAIVGPSGAGKTTLVNLIPRFYEVTGGSIKIDGKDIRQYTLKSLRSNVGMVQQDVYLFSGTILDNILYGRPGASREEAIDAAKKAGAHDFIMQLEHGYDTYTGERGVKLSGGQRQKISIARLFLKDPPVILLDEATSSLDNESEYEVAKALTALSDGRTSITIAHRLSTIRYSDRIVVLTDEGIAEEGTHEELMAKKGLYCELNEIAERMR